MSDLFSCLVMKITIRHDRVTAIGRKLSYKYYKSPSPTTVRNGDFASVTQVIASTLKLTHQYEF